jgi:predicted membrane-bound spermidine synthase
MLMVQLAALSLVRFHPLEIRAEENLYRHPFLHITSSQYTTIFALQIKKTAFEDIDGEVGCPRLSKTCLAANMWLIKKTLVETTRG